MKKRLNFHSHGNRFDAATHTAQDALTAAIEELACVSSDLGGVDDTADARFLDYIGDSMADHEVPKEVLDVVKRHLKVRKYKIVG
jgi:hypothetical protein